MLGECWFSEGLISRSDVGSIPTPASNFQVYSLSGALSVEEGAIFGEVKLIADLTNNKLRVIPIDRSMKKIPVSA